MRLASFRLDEPATGEIIDIYRTCTAINDREVVGYNVLICDAGGSGFASCFEDDEFNVFPPSGFGVRFLPGFPRDSSTSLTMTVHGCGAGATMRFHDRYPTQSGASTLPAAPKHSECLMRRRSTPTWRRVAPGQSRVRRRSGRTACELWRARYARLSNGFAQHIINQ